MNSDEKIYVEVADIINDKILKKLMESRLTVFLIGAGKDKRDSIREKIRLELINKKYITWFDVYYPEDIFEALIKGKIGFNLLDLENHLADSVNTIVIILESFGSIAEFGAFAVHAILKNKLLVVLNKKYRRAKSFINQGLIKYIRGETDSKVIYHDFNEIDLSNLTTSIRKDIRDISKKTTLNKTVTNIINAQYFLLAAIYLTEPVKKSHLKLMVNYVTSKIKEKDLNIKDDVILLSAISILNLSKDIELKGQKYCLTQNGLARFKGLIYKEPERSEINNLLDSLRIKVLNSTLRKQNKIKKGEMNNLR